MRGTYCSKCNHFFYSYKTEHYCRRCRTLLIDIHLEYEEFAALSANERYKLAYRLTSEYNRLKRNKA